MRRSIIAPDLGGPVPQLSVWYVQPGERVYAGDRVVELLLAGATFDVPAPASGRLEAKTRFTGETAPPGEVLGYIEELE